MMKTSQPTQVPVPKSSSPGQDSGHPASQRPRLRPNNPATIAGLLVLAIVVLAALLAPLIAPGNPQTMSGPSLLRPFTDPSFPLGTDALGRDLLASVLHGARVSLFVGIAAAAISLGVGIAIGSTAGYFGGWVDDLIVRTTEIFQTIPSFVMLLVLVALAEPSITTVIVGIALTSWDQMARIVRAEFRAIRERDYIMAARSAGYGNLHILWREILPNALPPIVVSASVMVASAILTESALSFMGLGDPNLITWGSMIGEGRSLIRTHWYASAIPGLCIVLTVLALNLIGDGINAALDPRRRQRRAN